MIPVSSWALPEILLFFFIRFNAATTLMTVNMVPVFTSKPTKLWTQFGYAMHHTALRQADVHLPTDLQCWQWQFSYIVLIQLECTLVWPICHPNQPQNILKQAVGLECNSHTLVHMLEKKSVLTFRRRI